MKKKIVKTTPVDPRIKHRISPERRAEQAQLLANRVKKRYNHLRRSYARKKIDCFRLYDWDIPEIRAVVDWYKGHVVIGEYVRYQTGKAWLPAMAKAVGEALNVRAENIHIKQRQTSKGDNTPRYHRMEQKDERIVVNEGDLQFYVNLNDFLDTGLFSDHRNTRVIIRDLVKEKDFLNLFAYTGAFTCAAAKGGAKRTVTVDRSETYLDWASDNLDLNELNGPKHDFIKSDVPSFLKKTFKDKQRFDVVLLDPPSFFQDKKTNRSFDIDRNHPELINDVIPLIREGGELFFSTNHQRFEPKFEFVEAKSIQEITPGTIPEDYFNKKIHRCWRIRV